MFIKNEKNPVQSGVTSKLATATESNYFKYNDGSRDNYFKGKDAGDCVIRAIAIATDKDYLEVYKDIKEQNKLYAENHRDYVAKEIKRNGPSPRNGVWKEVYKPYIKSLGWWNCPTMGIGTGCKVHVNPEELPKGRLILNISRHLTAMIDGVVNDTYDCSRQGTRCVYSFFYHKSNEDALEWISKWNN